MGPLSPENGLGFCGGPGRKAVAGQKAHKFLSDSSKAIVISVLCTCIAIILTYFRLQLCLKLNNIMYTSLR